MLSIRYFTLRSRYTFAVSLLCVILATMLIYYRQHHQGNVVEKKSLNILQSIYTNAKPTPKSKAKSKAMAKLGIKSPTLTLTTLSRTNKCNNKLDWRHIKVVRHKKIYQELVHNHRKIYLYGAYYDDRKAHSNGKKFIQILAVGVKINSTVYSQMWFNNHTQMGSVSRCSVTKHGNGDTIDSLYYGQYFLSCQITSNGGKSPKFVSVSFNKCTLSSNLLIVHIPERKRKHKFSVCVETGYGHVDPYVLIEFVETNRIMGVTMINVYPCNVSASNMRVFRQYEREGIMKIFETPSPLPETSWVNQMLSSPISFNDCMFRQIYSAEYIIPIDYDEVISPRQKAHNYETLLKEVDSIYHPKEPFGVYSFRSSLFFTTCGTNFTEPKYGNIIRYVKKTNFYGHLKSIVNPRKCLSVFNHYCKVYFRKLKGFRSIKVNESIAIVNHYRISWSDRLCRVLHKDGIVDTLFKDRFGSLIWKGIESKVAEFTKLRII